MAFGGYTIDLSKLSTADLEKDEVLEKIRKEVKQHTLRLYADLSMDYYRQLKKLVATLPKTKVELKEEYLELIDKLGLVALSTLSENDLKQTLHRSITKCLTWDENDYDLKRELDFFIIAKKPERLRDNFKKDIISVLRKSDDRLTQRDLVDQAGKKLPPTVGNWLTLYEQSVGAGSAQTLNKTEFIYQSENAKILSESDRKKLIRIIDFYEHLKVTSEHPVGIEEKYVMIDGDRIVEIDHGEVIDLGLIPEAQQRKDDPGVIDVPHPELDTFLEKDDRPDAKKKEEPKKEKDKFVKPDPMKVVFDAQKDARPNIEEHRSVAGAVKPKTKKRSMPKIAPLKKSVPKPVAKTVPTKRPRVVEPSPSPRLRSNKKPVATKRPRVVEPKPKLVATKRPRVVEPSPSPRLRSNKKPVATKRPRVVEPVANNQSVRATYGKRPSVSEAMNKIKTVEAEAEKSEEMKLPEAIESQSKAKQKKSFLPSFRRKPAATQKNVISDIKAPKRVMSPMDELELMSLGEFRELAARPEEVISKIKEKIDLFEEESMEKKAQGIQAWKKSPVNNLYVKIGEQSIMQGKAVREIIAEREQKSEETLTHAEFEALADLNMQLRF